MMLNKDMIVLVIEIVLIYVIFIVKKQEDLYFKLIDIFRVLTYGIMVIVKVQGLEMI